MSEFERSLKAARRRQARFHAAALFGVAALAAGVAGMLFATSGTRIEVFPEEAEASVHVVEGLTVAVGRAVYGLSRSPVIAVRANGFAGLTRRLAPEERGRAVPVVLAPLPGRIVAEARPRLADTSWRVNGKPVAVGAGLDREVEAGRHDVAADHPFFLPAARAVEVGRGETAELAFSLRGVRGRWGGVAARGGAVGGVEGGGAGRTPLERAVDGGVHRLELVASGYRTLADTVRITRGRPEVERRYVLERLSATLTFSVDPPDGRLLVDGRRVPPSEPLRVTAGEDHRVVYLRPGYRRETRTVGLAPGEAREMRFALAPRLGEVEIRTEPPAEILVDGKRRGEGRLALPLTAEPHRIEMRRPGYRTAVRTVAPREGGRIVVSERLLTEAAARLAEAPREYRSPAGPVLALFEPGPFVMGAPRGERGRRANEFERRVDLRKPFYASRHEVTNAQFSRFRAGRSGAGDEPVTNVSWDDAAAFANWMSAGERLPPFYRISNGRVVGIDPASEGYRLLTEAEWEWLARRAGRTGRTVFPWGDADAVPDRAGNIADETAKGVVRRFVPGYNDGFARVAPAGSFPAERSGLFDLAGNVREWVHDRYSAMPPEPGAARVDPLGPRHGNTRVVKGPGWRSGTRTTLRASYRQGLSGGRDDVGFRIGRYLHVEDGAR